jgi:hypothetical protein
MSPEAANIARARPARPTVLSDASIDQLTSRVAAAHLHCGEPAPGHTRAAARSQAAS